MKFERLHALSSDRVIDGETLIHEALFPPRPKTSYGLFNQQQHCQYECGSITHQCVAMCNSACSLLGIGNADYTIFLALQSTKGQLLVGATVTDGLARAV
ncbi:hypothetical protein BDR05DRAFT_963107 [Suillus weaverae]|nr:hypothetical protein BDR05DRAFT_963107 [Suillus weaverae]